MPALSLDEVLSRRIDAVSSSTRPDQIDLILNSTNPESYCIFVSGMASQGAHARWLGAPLEFKIITIKDYYALREYVIQQTGKWTPPKDGVYIAIMDTTTAQEIEGFKRILDYGWTWMDQRIKDYPTEPNWMNVGNAILDQCNASSERPVKLK